MASSDRSDDNVQVKPGQKVYDEDGNHLGQIQGFTARGFEVNMHEEVEGFSLEHDPGQGFGEGYLMWRCSECGEMGDLDDGMPEACPDCGASKEALFAWTED